MQLQIKQAFVQELSRPESQMNLAMAALLFSEYLTQTIDKGHYLALLDEMAQTIQPAIDEARTTTEIVETLNRFLFVDLEFSGNAINYYRPDNSFLDRVLDTKTGIPISLSLLYLEVGLRLQLPLWGIGMPGHFIVAYGRPSELTFIDVFNQGQALSEDDCLALCRVAPADRQGFRDRFLTPVTKRAILFRMLLNLKQIYIKRSEWEQAHKTVDLMLTVYPDQINELKDRGLLAYRLNRLHDTVVDLQRYLFLSPDDDESPIKEQVERIEEKLARLN